MREEISAAVVFITRLLRQNGDVSKEKVEEFSDCLSAILVEKFRNHWYSDHPTKGQGYRCIRINDFEPIDPVLEKAASESGLRYRDLHLPPELTLWVDPEDVCCRLGESRGTICTLAAKKDGNLENRAHSINIQELLLEGQERHNEQVNIVTTRSNLSNNYNYHGNHFSKGLHHGANSNFYSKQQHNFYNNQQFQMTHNRFRPHNKNQNRRHPAVQEQVNGVRHSPEHVNEVRQQFLDQVTTAARSSENEKPLHPKPINLIDSSTTSTLSSSSSSTDQSNSSTLTPVNKSGNLNTPPTKSTSGNTNKGGNSNPTSNLAGPKPTQPKGKTTNQGSSSVNQGVKPGSYNGGKQGKGGYPHLTNQKVAQKVH